MKNNIMLNFQLLSCDDSPFDFIECQFELEPIIYILSGNGVNSKGTNANLKFLDRRRVHNDPDVCILWCPSFLENGGDLGKSMRDSSLILTKNSRLPDVFFLAGL